MKILTFLLVAVSYHVIAYSFQLNERNILYFKKYQKTIFTPLGRLGGLGARAWEESGSGKGQLDKGLGWGRSLGVQEPGRGKESGYVRGH